MRCKLLLSCNFRTKGLDQAQSCEITCNDDTFLPKYLPGSCAKTVVYRRTITVISCVENAISVMLNISVPSELRDFALLFMYPCVTFCYMHC